MKKIHFLFGIHNHQPIGNFEHVFEEAYDKAYAPFLDAMARHPGIRWSLHCTGILWEWLERKRPDYLQKVRMMIERGQLELLSGGFYEPILSVIPDDDKIGQIQKLNQFLESRFHQKAKGMWCAERVWEPHLPKYIRRAGIEFTVLDDMHFLSAGLPAQSLNGYYRVEEQDESIDIFPIAQELRYSIPFLNPEETIKILKRVAEESENTNLPVHVMADDGEKFGLWPGTNSLIYQEMWLERFLKMLEDNASWIQTETFSGYRSKARALGKVYLPTASYFEMSEWSLPTPSGIEFNQVVHQLQHEGNWESAKRFTKGGIWRNFFSKYPEANGMYKKMLRVSRKIHERQGNAAQPSADLNQALDHLWAGQCNCSYWHGAFGGLYLPFLRNAIYKSLIDAEKDLDRIELANGHKHSGLGSRVEVVDYDGDGKEEILVETPAQNVYIAPLSGGSIVEWDFKPASVNIGNVLTRRPEIYHAKLKDWAAKGGKNDDSSTKSIHDLVQVKERGLENILFYDWYRRASAIDHFLHPKTTLEAFKKSQYGEQGDFVLGEYSFQEIPGGKSEKFGSDGVAIQLSRQGALWADGRKQELRIEKTFHLKMEPHPDEARLEVAYKIFNPSGGRIEDLFFAPEFNFSFSTPDPDFSESSIKRWERTDPYLFWKLSAEFSSEAGLWAFPLETVSNSESGFEKTFQGLVFLPHWKFSLGAGEQFERTLTFHLAKA